MSSSDSSVDEAKKCPANKVKPKVGQKRRQRKHDKRWSMKCILLKLNGDSFEGKNWQRFYHIQKIGDNVKFTKKGKYFNINLEGSKNKKIILLVKYGGICHLKKISFFTEVGKMIQGENAQIKKEGYVVLATFQAEHKLRNLNVNINNMDLAVAKNI